MRGEHGDHEKARSIYLPECLYFFAAHQGAHQVRPTAEMIRHPRVREPPATPLDDFKDAKERDRILTPRDGTEVISQVHMRSVAHMGWSGAKVVVHVHLR